MAHNARPRRRWCGTHGMYYPAWADAKRTKLVTCFKCDDEKLLAEAAAKRRVKQSLAKAPQGEL